MILCTSSKERLWYRCVLQWVFLFFGLVLLPSAAYAADSLASLEGRVIEQIEIKGLNRIEKDAVIEKLHSKKGDVLSGNIIKKDVKEVYGMGYFKEVEVYAEPSSAKTVKLIFELRERPVIAVLNFDGNERVDTDDLKEVVKIKEWAILDINAVREDVDRIQRHYEEKGFYLAKVYYDVKKVEGKDDEVELTFKINDFDKVEIKKITFLNNKIFTDKQLKRILLETQEGSLFSFLSGAGSFRESAFKNDLQRLTYWYLDHGYVKFRYENPVVTVSDDKKWLYVSIYVDEGEQYTMGSIDFEGDLLFPKKELYEELTLTTGNTFKISQRNADIQRMTEKYQDLGYAFVNVIPKPQIDDKNRIFSITYNFEKGNLVYFGEIRVVGNAKTHDKVIRRELRIHERELYNGTNLRKSKERVERLGYFAPGEVIFNTITPEGHDDILDLEISVKERSTGTITVGAGYGSIQKFFLTAQVSEINLLGRGQTLSFQAQYAADDISKSFNLGFTDPYAFDTHWSLGADFFFINFPIPRKYSMRKLGFDIRLGHPLSDDVNAFITYKNEGLKIVDKSRVNSEINTSLDEGQLSSIVWSVVRDKRNNRFETSAGSYQSLSFETAGISILGGDKHFLKWNFNNRYYFRIIGDLVFRNSTEYGQVVPAADDPVPPAERYYLGGPNNMKGYDIFSLGPKRQLKDSFVEPLGGVVQMFSLFEIEYPLIPEAGVKWVMFYDVGNAFSHFPGVGTEKLRFRQDAGFGIRWFSPIGPLRFEWGFPIAQKPGESSPVFNFFIGPPF